MTDLTERRAPVAARGLIYLAATSVIWGISWPVTKFVMSEWPPLPVRGLTGLAGAAALFGYGFLRGEDFTVPRPMHWRLAVSAFLNVTIWMTVMGLALLWLPASEAAVIAYTMPIWTALLAWPLLGERLSMLRVIALVLAFGGIAALMVGNGFEASTAKLPGVALALIGAVGFALGTIFLKRFPILLPAVPNAAWQFAIGCLPVALIGLAFEVPRFAALTPGGWAALIYLTVLQFCVAYLTWFAAVKLLPASVAAIGTMAVPVVGVVTAALALGEPLGIAKIAALTFTLAGVALATRG